MENDRAIRHTIFGRAIAPLNGAGQRDCFAVGAVYSEKRHFPGARPCREYAPIAWRINRSVGKDTAAVICLTWRFLPSVSVNSIHEAGIFLRKRMGGVRGQRLSGSSIGRTCAGIVLNCLSVTPRRSLFRAISSGTPSICTQYVLGSLCTGLLIRFCNLPSLVSSTKPSLSVSSRPAG